MRDGENLGFDSKLELRLINTPVTLDEIVEVLRSKEAAVAGVIQSLDSPPTRITYAYEILPVIEGFLRSAMKGSDSEIKSIDEFKELLEQFWNSIQQKETKWKNYAMRLFAEIFGEAKAHRFAEELPREDYERQLTVNKKVWAEVATEMDNEGIDVVASYFKKNTPQKNLKGFLMRL